MLIESFDNDVFGFYAHTYKDKYLELEKFFCMNNRRKKNMNVFGFYAYTHLLQINI